MKLFLCAILLASAAPTLAADTSHCKDKVRVPGIDANQVQIEENVVLTTELITCTPMKKRGFTEHGLVVRVNGKEIDFLLAAPTMSSSITLLKADQGETMDATINYVRAVPSPIDEEAQTLEAGQLTFFNRGKGVFEKGPFQSVSAATATK